MKAAALLAALVLLPAAGRAGRDARVPCPQVRIEGSEVELTEVERRLVCGDPEREAWREVPLGQARYLLRAFLQQRGYPSPSFEIEGGTLVARAGTRALIRALAAEGLPPEIDLGKRRRLVGEPLTPARLDEYESWLRAALQARGRGCPEVSVTADAATGELRARVSPGPVHALEDVRLPELSRIDPRVLRRYEAFERGKPLDLRLLTLSSMRVTATELFSSAYYDLRCSSGGALTVHQRVSSAAPRLAALGLGVDTEGFVRARARWRNARVGYRASALESTLFASYREQSLETLMRWYPAPDSRFHAIPRAAAARQHEARFETVSAQVQLSPAYVWDDQRVQAWLQAGPALEYVDTLRGEGPAPENFLVLETRASLTEHLHELNQREPREGWTLGLETRSRQAGAHSRLSAHRFRLQGQWLWNLGDYDPPAAVLGWRGLAGATLLGAGARRAEDIPPTMRFFLGGDRDLRGFSRQELPGDGSGYLSALYHGLELRAGDVLPLRLQPLLFADAAMAGPSELDLRPDVYYSPGFGLRWPAPFGSLRATAARALTWRRGSAQEPVRPHWQLFFGLGAEF